MIKLFYGFGFNRYKLLELLQKDGRVSYREIVKQLGITTPTVSKKVETFQKLELLKGFSAYLDAEELDEIIFLLHIECKPSNTKKLLDQFFSLNLDK